MPRQNILLQSVEVDQQNPQMPGPKDCSNQFHINDSIIKTKGATRGSDYFDQSESMPQETDRKKNTPMRGSSRGVSKYFTPGKAQRTFKTTEMRSIVNAGLKKRTEQPKERKQLIFNNQNKAPVNESILGKSFGPIKVTNIRFEPVRTSTAISPLRESNRDKQGDNFFGVTRVAVAGPDQSTRASQDFGTNNDTPQQLPYANQKQQSLLQSNQKQREESSASEYLISSTDGVINSVPDQSTVNHTQTATIADEEYDYSNTMSSSRRAVTVQMSNRKRSQRSSSGVRHKPINTANQREMSASRVPVQKTKSNDLQSRAIAHKDKSELIAKYSTTTNGSQEEEKKVDEAQSSQINVTADPVEIFQGIHKEQQELQTLPKRKGNLQVQILAKSRAQAELRQVYCYLRNKQFKFFKDQTMLVMEGMIDFDLVQTVVMIDDHVGLIDPNEPKQLHSIEKSAAIQRSQSANTTASETNKGPQKFRIEIKGEVNLVFIFQAASHKALLMWFNAILKNWSAGKAMSDPRALQIPAQIPNFWKQNWIRAEDMNRLADTGDIIFFSSKMLVANIQRFVTASEYDHTAMFLRFANGQLIYLESAGNTGVQIFRWDYFFDNKLYQNFTKMAFRKVRCSRALSQLSKLEEFVNKVRGNDYSLDFSKLLRSTCDDDDDVEKITDSKAFFCSEVVAAAHKVLDILPTGVPASQYWPSTFTKPTAYLNNELVAKNNEAYYEDLQEVIFD